MLEHTDRHPDVHTAIFDLRFGLSLELWFVDGELSGAVWLFCDRYLGEVGVGEA